MTCDGEKSSRDHTQDEVRAIVSNFMKNNISIEKRRIRRSVDEISVIIPLNGEDDGFEFDQEMHIGTWGDTEPTATAIFKIDMPRSSLLELMDALGPMVDFEEGFLTMSFKEVSTLYIQTQTEYKEEQKRAKDEGESESS